MSCFNCSGECCFDETGCIYNNGNNSCGAEKWGAYHNAMPVESKPTMDKFKRRLLKSLGFYGEVVITPIRKGILGKHYDVVTYVLMLGDYTRGELIIRDGIYWYSEYKQGGI